MFLSINLINKTQKKVERLHFGEELKCAFMVKIDPYIKYAQYVQGYGITPPQQLAIPYNVIYYKMMR
jgi:hypothetical protein